jgi:hypothetical protein
MDTQEYFKLIDKGITSFNADGRFIISNDTHSDWLIFDVRNIIWYKDGIRFTIGIYPNFNQKEEIISWSLSAIAWFDKRGYRYSTSKVFADKVQLDEIATNINQLLHDAYDYIHSFKKSEIPKVTNLNPS